MHEKAKVILIGPYPENCITGGMEGVISSYLTSSIGSRYIYIATSCEGNLLQKIMAMGSCFFKLIFTLTFANAKIVHIHMASWGSFFRKALCVFVARLFRKKVILHLHGSEFKVFYRVSPKIIQCLITKVLDSLDLILVLSDIWARYIRSKTKNRNIKILFNPVDTSLFSSNPLRYGNDSETKDIVFLGAIGNRKGIYDLLEAITIILRSEASARFLICGDGELDKCKRICEHKGISTQVIFCGWVTGQEKIDKISNADVFVLPSYNEGLPVSIIEAMACALPIVSTYVGGIPDIIIDGVNGFLLEPGDVKGIADRIVKLLQNAPLRKKMGQANVTKARNLFDINTVIKEIDQIYQELLTLK